MARWIQVLDSDRPPLASAILALGINLLPHATAPVSGLTLVPAVPAKGLCSAQNDRRDQVLIIIREAPEVDSVDRAVTS
jgi:hypothetical protein